MYHLDISHYVFIIFFSNNLTSLLVLIHWLFSFLPYLGSHLQESLQLQVFFPFSQHIISHILRDNTSVFSFIVNKFWLMWSQIHISQFIRTRMYMLKFVHFPTLVTRIVLLYSYIFLQRPGRNSTSFIFARDICRRKGMQQ